MEARWRQENNSLIVDYFYLSVMASISCEKPLPVDVDTEVGCSSYDNKLKNSDVLSDLPKKVEHLSPVEQNDLLCLVEQYVHLFPDVPSRTSVLFHDVDVGDASPIKQNAYRTNAVKLEHMHKEVQYMLENDLIENEHKILFFLIH